MEATGYFKHAPTAIRAGLPFSELERVTALLALSLQEAAGLLLISERTLHRRRREGRFTQAESDRLVQLVQLTEAAVEAFDGHRAEAVEWLTTPKTLLEGETPLQYADTQPGRDAVYDMLAVIQFNMAA